MNGLSLPAFFRPIVLSSVGSTNEELKRFALAGAEEGTLVVAERQTAGRGRRGRNWQSPTGNLYASLLLRPDRAAAEALQLSFVAAVAVAEATAGLVPPGTPVRCKWPNDVLIDGRKVAGILLESAAGNDGRLEWLIIGVGINVTNHPPPGEAAYPATSFLAAGATGVDATRVLAVLCDRFLAWCHCWLIEGFSPIREAWRQRAAGLGEPITVNLEDETLFGTFLDLDADGALLLGQEGRAPRRITAGDVFLSGHGT